jgi:heme/copper-type cytochrome/quinol oxidase subunit 2
MDPRKRNRGVLAVAVIGLVAVVMSSGAITEMHSSQNSASNTTKSTESKIESALSAAPLNIAKAAAVAEMDSQRNLKVLREGTNGFTCMPGNPEGPGEPPMCADQVAMQWNSDFAEHKPKPTTTIPGIEYMLAGATQRSDSDPSDTTSPPIKIGPHWMILWPFDPKTTGLPTTHKATGAYIMWAGTPYAHLHVMGRP